MNTIFQNDKAMEGAKNTAKIKIEEINEPRTSRSADLYSTYQQQNYPIEFVQTTEAIFKISENVREPMSATQNIKLETGDDDDLFESSEINSRYPADESSRVKDLGSMHRKHSNFENYENCEMPLNTFLKLTDEDENFELYSEIKIENSDDNGLYHTETHYDLPFSERSKSSDEKSAIVPKKKVSVKNKKPHSSCPYCNLQFYNSSHLHVHLRIHSGEKPYSCEFCDRKFAQSGGLNRHRRTHSGEKPFSCEICDRKFTQKTQLKVHVRIHSGEKPFSCEYCGQCFTKSCNLSIHIRTHTGERPFPCPFCERKFTQKSSLIRHNMRKHSNKSTS